MNRLIVKTVFSGFVTDWRLATVAHEPLAGLRESHHRRGRAPTLGIRDDLGLAAVHTAMHELVVPRSMPIVLAMRRVAS